MVPMDGFAGIGFGNWRYVLQTFMYIALFASPGTVHAVNTEVKSSTGTLETITRSTKDSPNNQGPMSPNRVLPGERPQRKNYLIPALELPAFPVLLNQFDP